MIGMKCKKSIATVTLVVLVIVSFGGNIFAQEKVYRLDFVAGEAGTADYQRNSKYIEMFNKAAGGRIILNQVGQGEIVPNTQEMMGVNDGIIDAGTCPCAWAQSQIPTSSLFSGAVGGLPDAAMDIWLRHFGGFELMEEAWAQGFPNLKLIAPPGSIMGEVWGYSKKKIEKPEDIKGLRMRCMGDAGEIFNRMGASVIFLPGGEIYEAMSRGVIDWAEWADITAGWDYGFQEIAEYAYFSLTRAPSNRQAIFVNKGVWESLPEDLQAFMMTWAEYFKRLRYEEMIQSDMNTLPKLEEFGVKVLRVPESVENALLEEAKKFYEEKSAADPFFGKVYHSQQSFKEQYLRFEELMLR